MNKLFFALSAGLIMAATPIAVSAQSPKGEAAEAKKQPKPSRKALKSLIALSKAVDANDPAAIAKALPEAKANAETADDKFLIAQLQAKVALAANDNAALDAAIDQMAESNYLEPREMATLFQGQGGTHFNAKDFAAAARSYERALAYDPANVESMIGLAETRFSQGQGAEAAALLQKVIATSVAAGTKPEAEIYKRAAGIAFSSKSPAVGDLARQWVEAYPTSESWHNMLAVYQNTHKLDLATSILLYRLMSVSKAMTNSDDYMLYSSTAYELGNYVESQASIDAGLAAGTIKPTTPVIKDVIDALAAKPKTTAADLAEAAASVKDAKGKVRVAERYFGIGDYAKAIELYRQAEGGAGIDPNMLKMQTGIALARSGDKAGAEAAFAGVSGALLPIANFWRLYIKQMA